MRDTTETYKRVCGAKILVSCGAGFSQDLWINKQTEDGIYTEGQQASDVECDCSSFSMCHLVPLGVVVGIPTEVTGEQWEFCVTLLDIYDKHWMCDWTNNLLRFSIILEAHTGLKSSCILPWGKVPRTRGISRPVWFVLKTYIEDWQGNSEFHVLQVYARLLF